jgi:hypothetical protein
LQVGLIQNEKAITMRHPEIVQGILRKTPAFPATCVGFGVTSPYRRGEDSSGRFAGFFFTDDLNKGVEVPARNIFQQGWDETIRQNKKYQWLVGHLGQDSLFPLLKAADRGEFWIWLECDEDLAAIGCGPNDPTITSDKDTIAPTGTRGDESRAIVAMLLDLSPDLVFACEHDAGDTRVGQASEYGASIDHQIGGLKPDGMLAHAVFDPTSTELINDRIGNRRGLELADPRG